MQTFEIVKKLMQENGIKKQTDLARIIYQKNKIEPKERVNMSGYLIGAVNFPDFALERMAEHFGVTLDYLSGRDNKDTTSKVPVRKNASCGARQLNTLQEEGLMAHISTKDWNKNLYAVIANGDSMATEIYDGDRVIIDPLIKPVPGDIVYYELDEECAIKVLAIDEEAHLLQFIPYNPSECFKTRTVRLDDEETLDKLLMHKVIEVNSSKRNNRAARLRMIGR